MNNDHQGARVYLIHTAQHPRPFLTTVPFVARDFAAWGYRVDHHAADSAYIVEVRAREKMQHMRRKARSASRRTKLMEIWAHEVLERKRGERGNVSMTTPAEEVDTGFGAIEARVKKAGDVVQDFINGVAALGSECDCSIPMSLDDILLRPGADFRKDGKNVSMRHSQQTIATKYTRLLYAVRYNPNTPLPAWSNPDIVYADQVILEFSHHEAIQKEHLVHAVSSAIGKNEGRMGRVEKCTRTGVKRVLLWVDVGDVLMGAAGFVEEGEVDPVPKYERGEGPPVYVKG
ncbi:hypothetical protein PtrCC142_005660 [Pyrenophora tritici-repentis]|uniref:Uncharacterized protein n=1 Tax=Pyrenophora tritici-repentis (strain Pt-1C-BFP) TaxID=426418 RepID=B2WGY7_PYRTR|nr:uncharacterized protein PTRG_09193 [Pyrenophora tritici-repentis Pt-1C-BFP]KAF7442181.1 hypothetical protein A1F99_130500 [Pyrenophora tritici-repentis]EDU42244.1 predicted protein [Pyrenophora tritici-repentis Pt-1C-BFP]KAI1535112.1 hypothetical protein PtrSN001A_006142 [Pyrenophora tritici-repentis]KAI1538533.1 hypothetical protein PtrSN001C_005658 [Pyrenophora tritici-repentis]KAI1571168.1 hypothetical protein PtrEW4_004932 [Pyrenophora tritici-repentis]